MNKIIEIRQTTLEIFIQIVGEDFSKFLKDQNNKFYRELIEKLEREIK